MNPNIRWIKLTRSEVSKKMKKLGAGGANSYRHNIFKAELQNLSNKIGMTLQIAHYPPYTSKWNPIEHRVSPHITRSMDGILINSLEE
jgi:hypothetical protein